MKNKILIFGVVAVLFLGCKKKSAGPNEVYIQNYKFNPSSITVSKGTTITWTNKESGIYPITHTVTSDNAIFDSDNLDKRQQFSYTFSTPGTFPYHCNRHTDMKATVIVE